MNTYITNQARNLKATGLALLVASSMILTGGCATNKNSTYTRTTLQRTYTPRQTYAAQQTPAEKKGKIRKFFDGLFKPTIFDFFVGF
ncbi:MAG: hypothetical protein AABX07_03570 [Nanoarchaeota archaeon]